MARKYSIPIPYTTSGKDGLAISMGLNMPEVHAALSRLRPDLVAKLQRCSFFHHETFTKAELDSVPDDLWSQLAPHLG
jgi:hypothetical protein